MFSIDYFVSCYNYLIFFHEQVIQLVPAGIIILIPALIIYLNQPLLSTHAQIMKKSQTISTRISKVNEELEKLTNLLQHEHQFFNKTKQALQQFVPDEDQSEESSFNYYQIQSHLTKSKGFFQGKIQVVSQFQVSGKPEENEDVEERTEVVQSRTADITVKKFRPVHNPTKKKKQSSEKPKESSKLKNSRSENKLSLSTKPEQKKSSSKQQLKKPQQYHLTTNLKGLYKKLKTNQNLKTTSQNRLNAHSNLNQSMKMHINLKKQVNMKITDLNIQKQQCQKQAEYLKAVMMIERQGRIQSLGKQMRQDRQEREDRGQAIGLVMARLLVNFFSQFFSQRIVLTDQCCNEQLFQVISRKNYLLKHMLKLPDIIKQDNKLCQSRVANLFSEKHQIDHVIHMSLKHSLTDSLYICVDSLHSYISFLINNNVVRQTKRKLLPYQFNSERSKGALHGQQHQERQLGQVVVRQYDSDRKMKDSEGKGGQYRSVNSKGLRRTNTQKVLSPKTKIYSKNYVHKQR